jgi:hypothetical protein
MQRRHAQTRLAVLMASIAFVAILLAAARDPSLPLVTLVLTLTIIVLLTAAWRARVAITPGARAWWLGFSIFGWTYFVLAGRGWGDRLPNTILVGRFVEWLTIHYGPFPTPTGRGPWYTDDMHRANTDFFQSAMPLGQLYLTLIVALAGALLTWAVAGLAPVAIACVRGFRNRLG